MENNIKNNVNIYITESLCCAEESNTSWKPTIQQ